MNGNKLHTPSLQIIFSLKIFVPLYEGRNFAYLKVYVQYVVNDKVRLMKRYGGRE